MAISYVGGKADGAAGQGGGSISLTTGLTGGSGGAALAGDLVVVTVSVGTAGRTPSIEIATPTGYTALTVQRWTAEAYDANVQTCYKVMGATPDTAVTIPASGNVGDGISYAIQVFRGVDATTPMDATPTYATSGGVNNRPNPAAITPVTVGAWIVCCGGGAASAGGTYLTTTLTNFLIANGSDTNDGTVGVGYYTGWTSGSYDPAAFTGGSSTIDDSWGATTIALRPAPLVITANAGSYTQTGSSATLSRNKALEAGAGSYTLSGVNASLSASRQISGEAGSYTLTGADAVLGRSYALTANAGAYVLTGADAVISKAYTLTANTGVYAFGGVIATLSASSLLEAEPGSYTLTGSDAALTFATAAAYELIASPGSYRLSSYIATLRKSTNAGRRKTYGKAYLKQENEILVFPSEEAKEDYLKAQEQAKQAINRAQRRAVIATQPKPAKVDLERIETQAQIYKFESIPRLIVESDYQRILEIHQAIQQMLEDETIELLLLA